MPTIRPAEPGDAARIADLLGQLGYPARGVEVSTRLARRSGPENAVLVAVDDARIVGVTSLHRMPTLHSDSPVAYITAFVVETDQRGRGVGRRLLQAAEAWARSAGCGRLTVTSAEARSGAHEFYPRCGLPYTGRRYAKALD